MSHIGSRMLRESKRISFNLLTDVLLSIIRTVCDHQCCFTHCYVVTLVQSMTRKFFGSQKFTVIWTIQQNSHMILIYSVMQLIQSMNIFFLHIVIMGIYLIDRKILIFAMHLSSNGNRKIIRTTKNKILKFVNST